MSGKSFLLIAKRCVHQSVLKRPPNAGKEAITIVAVRDKMKKLVGAPVAFGEEHLQADRTNLENLLAKSQVELPARRLYDSYAEAIIPIGQDAAVREEYHNAFHRVRFGRLLEDLDTFAVMVTYKHTLHPASLDNNIAPMAIVTGMVDRIDIENRQIPTDKDIRLRGITTWVGESSAETLVIMEQEQFEVGSWEKILEARFVLVARDPKHGRKAFLNPLKPDGPDEQLLYDTATENHSHRKQWNDESLFKLPPNPEEIKIIHDRFLQTVDHKESVYSLRVKPANTAWMEEAVLKNIHICHPQNRNIYGKVFGGFLMRNAFELAWSNAYVYCGSRPVILSIDDIKFRKPVEIGSLLMMSARMVYTEGPDMQIRVLAEVFDPVTRKRETTNTFYFTFRDASGNPVKAVMPKTYAESMLYLTGRRHYAASKHYQRLMELSVSDVEKKGARA